MSKNFTKKCPVRNILSYKMGTNFSGKEIKEWIRYHTENDTSHSKVANKLIGYLETLSDDEVYMFYKNTYHSSEGYMDYFIKRVNIA